MTFLEAMSDYIDISDSFDSANMKAVKKLLPYQ